MFLNPPEHPDALCQQWGRQQAIDVACAWLPRVLVLMAAPAAGIQG